MKNIDADYGKEVDAAEGTLLNEIHEHISIGITMGLTNLVIAARKDGFLKGRTEGFKLGLEEGREQERAKAPYVDDDFSMTSHYYHD